MKTAVLIGVIMFMQPVLAEDLTMDVESHQERTIEGSWELNVTSEPGPGAPPPFKALITFMPGGTCIETVLLPPIVPAHGAWIQTGTGRYTFTVVHPILDANGNHFATVRATSYVKVTGSRSFTATFEGNLYDPNGNVIAPLKGTETATRIRVR